MKAIIEDVNDKYVFCRREDKVIIQILLKFLNNPQIGDVIYLPETRYLN
ncbi:hypothetical protein KQI86_14615 [Clostridium sp. MSJ-11]|uniref:Uncharacterized protein n=1 Tax=Clostridium mobile TaxID=2841512 RepID=A0ABS6EK14_9CLOT|nr:hypothetical protein [Clostridium mobile]MBU5485551.1 hypothetical protein [Clostridium mobile]